MVRLKRHVTSLALAVPFRPVMLSVHAPESVTVASAMRYAIRWTDTAPTAAPAAPTRITPWASRADPLRTIHTSRSQLALLVVITPVPTTIVPATPFRRRFTVLLLPLAARRPVATTWRTCPLE